MGITISPLQENEIPKIVAIELEAFRSHPRIPALWRGGYTEDVYAFYQSGKIKGFRDPDSRFVKAVDDATGEIVATSQWTFSLDPAKLDGEEPVDPNGQPPANWPKEGNWEMRRFYNLNLEKWKKQSLTGKPYIMLDILVTHPDSQRCGAASKLLSWGTEQAQKLGATMALESTPMGMSLYKRNGFKAVDVIKADMKQFGWDKPYDDEAAKRVWMIRDPTPQ